MALRDKMRNSAAPYLPPGEPIQQVVGAQTASQYLAALGSVFVFLGLNRYRMLVVTPQRILVLDTGKMSQAKAKGVVGELPRSTRLGPGSGVWHVLPIGNEKLRIHRRFFKDMAAADAAAPTGAPGAPGGFGAPGQVPPQGYPAQPQQYQG